MDAVWTGTFAFHFALNAICYVAFLLDGKAGLFIPGTVVLFHSEPAWGYGEKKIQESTCLPAEYKTAMVFFVVFLNLSLRLHFLITSVIPV